jgi:sugar transferase (PEP-CTERM/EpsH1 system associated)
VKIKLLHILHSLQIGGLENGVINIINRLDNDTFEHAICCIDSSGPMVGRLDHPVEIHTLCKGTKRDYFLSFKIARLVQRIRPDIVHTRNWSAIDGVIGARIAGVKVIIHGEHGREATDPMGANRLRKKARKALNPWITKFVVVSGELKKWLLHDIGIPGRKVTQIINGVDTDKFRPAEDKQLAKTSLKLNPDSFVIGIVGRLDRVKDHETLFRAFRILSESNPSRNLHMLVVGIGPLKNRLMTLSKELRISSRTTFTGERFDLGEWYRCMDVYVLPSIAEGISNTILEAMACGLPVIATNVGGNQEIVKNGRTGFLFTPGNYQGLAEKLLLYRNGHALLKEHGIKGRITAEEKLSLSRMVKEYEGVYTSLLTP